jgi:hypothetical protein
VACRLVAIMQYIAIMPPSRFLPGAIAGAVPIGVFFFFHHTFHHCSDASLIRVGADLHFSFTFVPHRRSLAFHRWLFGTYGGGPPSSRISWIMVRGTMMLTKAQYAAVWYR